MHHRGPISVKTLWPSQWQCYHVLGVVVTTVEGTESGSMYWKPERIGIIEEPSPSVGRTRPTHRQAEAVKVDSLAFLSSLHPVPPGDQKIEERGTWVTKSVFWSTEKGKEEWNAALED